MRMFWAWPGRAPNHSHKPTKKCFTDWRIRGPRRGSPVDWARSALADMVDKNSRTVFEVTQPVGFVVPIVGFAREISSNGQRA